jgi:predicted Fe-S protein YdhL (DUF1289 family)
MHNEKYETSPCNSKCEVDRGLGFCLSCCRTIEEIRSWLKITNEERRQIKENARLRKSSSKEE